MLTRQIVWAYAEYVRATRVVVVVCDPFHFYTFLTERVFALEREGRFAGPSCAALIYFSWRQPNNKVYSASPRLKYYTAAQFPWTSCVCTASLCSPLD